MGFPVVLKIERAVTDFFYFRFESGVVELTKEHPGMAIRVEQAGQGCRCSQKGPPSQRQAEIRLAHRERETKEASAQALATLLLAAETQQSSSSSSAHSLQDVLLPVNKNNPKMYARIVTLIDEGRKRGEHLPTPRGVPAGSALPSMLMMTGSENNGMIQGGLNLAGTAMQPMVQSPQPYVSGGGAAIGVDLTKLQQQWGEVSVQF